MDLGYYYNNNLSNNNTQTVEITFVFYHTRVVYTHAVPRLLYKYSTLIVKQHQPKGLHIAIRQESRVYLRKAAAVV